MKKALINASVASMICKFSMGNIDILQSLGYQVGVACNFDSKENPISEKQIEECEKQLRKRHCRILDTKCPREVTAVGDMLKTYKQLKRIADREKYVLVHTQSPIGGVLCRLAFCDARKKYGTRVIYQAHGFHFYEGAPIQNWLFYYPIEKYCSRFTDTLVTINKEDYKRAKDNFYCKDVQYIPGVGIDASMFDFHLLTLEERKLFRESLGVHENALWLISVGELNKNKNHETVIRAISQLSQEEQNSLFYTIVGQGEKKDALQKLIESLGLHENVKLLGFRNDIAKLYEAADIYIISSLREGLNVSLMEAMASGLPCIVSHIRGNVDLIDYHGGERFIPTSVEGCRQAIVRQMKKSEEERKNIGQYNVEKIQSFVNEKVHQIWNGIYINDYSEK